MVFRPNLVLLTRGARAHRAGEELCTPVGDCLLKRTRDQAGRKREAYMYCGFSCCGADIPSILAGRPLRPLVALRASRWATRGEGFQHVLPGDLRSDDFCGSQFDFSVNFEN